MNWALMERTLRAAAASARLKSFQPLRTPPPGPNPSHARRLCLLCPSPPLHPRTPRPARARRAPLLRQGALTRLTAAHCQALTQLALQLPAGHPLAELDLSVCPHLRELTVTAARLVTLSVPACRSLFRLRLRWGRAWRGGSGSQVGRGVGWRLATGRSGTISTRGAAPCPSRASGAASSQLGRVWLGLMWLRPARVGPRGVAARMGPRAGGGAPAWGSQADTCGRAGSSPPPLRRHPCPHAPPPAPRRCPRLRALAAPQCVALQHVFPDSWDTPALEDLNLFGCRLLAGANLSSAVLSRAPRLRHLDLNGCWAVGALALAGASTGASRPARWRAHVLC